jgi:hypothetical protein
METARNQAQSSSRTKHECAVTRTLTWAEEAAASGDHADALAWLETLVAAGHSLSGEYQRKREAWRLALGNGRSANGSG